MQTKSARPFWSGAFDFRPQSSEGLSAHCIPMSGASLCTRHTYRVPRTDVRQHRNSIQPLAFYIFCCYVGAPRPKPSQTFVYKSLTKNFCFAPSKLFSQTTRLCAVGAQRAGSACRVLRAEIKASSKFKRETVSSFKLAP